jgi:hypothetical protein
MRSLHALVGILHGRVIFFSVAPSRRLPLTGAAEHGGAFCDGFHDSVRFAAADARPLSHTAAAVVTTTAKGPGDVGGLPWLASRVPAKGPSARAPRAAGTGRPVACLPLTVSGSPDLQDERRFRLLMRTRHGHLQEQKTLGSRLGSLY